MLRRRGMSRAHIWWVMFHPTKSCTGMIFRGRPWPPAAKNR
jgi:hypothetical protein